ncbi:hypothetical protein L8S13_02000 [Vibrio lentus]|uniref:GAP1-N1 domain-containing protein n=1 Tax=Vibrio lentus TaxID=136468 RepID=UPI0024695AC7|nr:hypothetical protein [Vibrio lentus]MDH5925056.1 hypothetical protein [Vibrio lentus]
MIKSYRASYGVKDKSHTLLEWSDSQEQPPKALLGLTDQPPGHLSIGDCWWPAFGCAPIEDWWAMWWTVPDLESSRGGMVRSEVVLWHLSDISLVNDLSPFIEQIAQDSFIQSDITDLLNDTAEALLSSNDKICVVQDISAFPMLVSLLWKNLWPTAREAFSVKVALTPPQNVQSNISPLLYCVPPSHINQWRRADTLIIDSKPRKLGRAAEYLVNGDDRVIKEIIAESTPTTANINYLSTAARCADRLEAFRQEGSTQSALNLVRTVIALCPEKSAGEKLKKEALSFLSNTLSADDQAVVLSLANVEAASVSQYLLPIQSVKDISSQIFPSLAITEVELFITRLSNECVQVWWRDSILHGIEQFISTQTPHCFQSILYWLGVSGASELLAEIVPSDLITESKFILATNFVDIEVAAIENIKHFTVVKQWSQLHAWTLLKTLPSSEVFCELNSVINDCSLGNEYLVQNLPGSTVIDEVLSPNSYVSIEQVAKRTSKEPGLLSKIDISSTSARMLWFSHILAGGQHWPEGINREDFERAFIDEILSGNHTGVVHALAFEVAETVLEHPNSSEIWLRLQPIERKVLCDAVTEVYISKVIAHEALGQPDVELTQSIINSLNCKEALSPFLVLHCLSWNWKFEESDIIQWITKTPSSEWRFSAEKLGLLVMTNGWKSVAQYLYDKCKIFMGFAKNHPLMPALLECFNLLSPLKVMLVQSVKGSHHSYNNEQLVREVSKLGNKLAYDRLESLWVGAGGDAKDIKISSSSADKWNDAAQKAEYGMLNSGLIGLVEGLIEEFPHNTELQDLKSILSNR